MARGRKPGIGVVVPMKEGVDPGHNARARALARAEQLRPEGLTPEVRWVYDKLAPALCHPSKDRLNEVNVYPAFILLCKAIVRFEKLELMLDQHGEVYETSGRNGKQRRGSPEAAQLNVVWGQIRQMANDFGMTPTAERALAGQMQMAFPFADQDDDFS
ncbi:MAG: P27 family phage terminase small subunit [Paracoccus sp. (in: a-proteobacteria)]|uniref:P27 family phage terminase small subunit n=1 Tax=Paracoccus sp. TaxID=267 RepID=UPI0026E078DB|nr:P27 family phage terminase small subunit [Paracoccus sp. (in: a-proteobacteria)]MDO5621928.1 P27 family phage terminase small subunit [Paracoccus sp. (in: a-proteobacteria)]